MPEKKIVTTNKRVVKKIVKSKNEAVILADVFDTNAKKIDQIELPKAIFSVFASDKLLAQYMRVYLERQRQGTKSTKTRAEVVGSGRKIYRQKGTGRARHGDIRAPIFVGGGITHAPKMHHSRLKINKKQLRKAFLYSLSRKLKNNDIFFVKGFLDFEAKTKKFVSVINNFNLPPHSHILLIYPSQHSTNLIRASRNLSYATLCNVESLNTAELLKKQKVFFAVEALEIMKKRFEN